MSQQPILRPGFKFRKIDVPGEITIEALLPEQKSARCCFADGNKIEIPIEDMQFGFMNGNFMPEPAMPERNRKQRVWVHPHRQMYYNVPGIVRFGDGWMNGNAKQRFLELTYRNGFVRLRADEVVVMDALEGIFDANSTELWEYDILEFTDTGKHLYGLLIYNAGEWKIVYPWQFKHDAFFKGVRLELLSDRRMGGVKVGSMYETPDIYDLMVKSQPAAKMRVNF